MSKKSIPSLLALLAPTLLLTGCPVYVDSYTGDPYLGSPDVVVVGQAVPDDISYTQPTYTQGSGDGNPIIDSFTQNINEVKAGQPVTFTVVAHDPNGRQLQFNWSSTGGVMSTNTGRVASWNPPTEAGVYTVTVVITNGNGGVATGSLNLTVKPAASAAPIAVPTATPTPIVVTAPTAIPTLAPTPTPAPVSTAAATAAATVSATTLSGLVKTDAGVLANCTVELRSGDANVPYAAKLVTGADGAFHFTNVPANTQLVIIAYADGYGEKLTTIKALAGQDTVFNFDGSYALARI